MTSNPALRKAPTARCGIGLRRETFRKPRQQSRIQHTNPPAARFAGGPDGNPLPVPITGGGITAMMLNSFQNCSRKILSRTV
jgi:hypothetical protein